MKTKNKQNKELGAGLVEYALLAALISTTAIAGVNSFGHLIAKSVANSTTQINNVGKGSAQANCAAGSQRVGDRCVPIV